MRKRIKRIGAIVLGFIIALGTKVLGVYNIPISYGYELLYGPPPETEVSTIEKFLPVLKILAIGLIPVILMIGLFIYVQKHKERANMAKKIYFIILVLLVLALITIIALYALGIINI